MTEIELQDVFELCIQAYHLYNEGKIEDAATLTLAIEDMASNYSDEHEYDLCLKYAAPCLIDIGFALRQRDMIERGTEHLKNYLEKYNIDDHTVSHELYNTANGYISAWKLNAEADLGKGHDSSHLVLARRYYRLAITSLSSGHFTKSLASQLYTNYGNTLDYLGRAVEALDAYDIALRIDPNMGMALGNKAVALMRLAPLTYGLTHRFYLEALRLLRQSQNQPITSEAREGFKQKLDQLNGILARHEGSMDPESVEHIEPENDFHQFLCEFCTYHSLFLSPVTMLGADGRTYYGDPMFIERMIVPATERDKADRYVTFLNEIKQEYVLGRYFLVQSQFSLPELDIVDEGVLLVYPLDYSLHSVYIQLLKAAIKQAISVLDKVAFFLYDYCKLRSPAADKVDFRQIWGGGATMPKVLRAYENPYLLALFYVARDVSKAGDWNKIYEHRNALTHRFLVLHDINMDELQANPDIPRELESVFTEQVILATKIARAAVMYLILFVALEEQKLAYSSSGVTPTIHATILDKGFRHRPPH